MTKVEKIWNGVEGRIKKMTPAAKASFALVFAKFFQKGLSLISGPIFTRIMPQAEYGITSTFNSWQNVLVIIATLNMASGVFNNGMLDYKDDRESYKFSILCLANLCTTALLMIYVLGHGILQPLLDMPDLLVAVMFAYFYVTPAYNYWLGSQRFDFKYKATTAVIVSSSLLSTALAVILVVLSPDEFKAIAKLLATEGISIALGLFFLIYLWIKSRAKLNIKYWKYALKFQLPLIPHYLSMYVLSSSDRIMISKLTNTSNTAIYNVAYTVASIMLILWNAVDASYAPWIYQNLEKGNEEKIRNRGNQILLMFACITVLSTLFAPEIIKVLAPSNYYSGIYVIPSVSASVFFTAVFSLYMRVELYYKKTKFAMYATCMAAISNLILNYIFIPVFGFYAAGYTTMASYMLLAIAHWVNLKKMNCSEIYDNRRILSLSIMILVCTVGMLLIYSNWIIRYAIIAVVCVILYIRRADVKTVLRK